MAYWVVKRGDEYLVQVINCDRYWSMYRTKAIHFRSAKAARQYGGRVVKVVRKNHAATIAAWEPIIKLLCDNWPPGEHATRARQSGSDRASLWALVDALPKEHRR